MYTFFKCQKIIIFRTLAPPNRDMLKWTYLLRGIHFCSPILCRWNEELDILVWKCKKCAYMWGNRLSFRCQYSTLCIILGCWNWCIRVVWGADNGSKERYVLSDFIYMLRINQTQTHRDTQFFWQGLSLLPTRVGSAKNWLNRSMFIPKTLDTQYSQQTYL